MLAASELQRKQGQTGKAGCKRERLFPPFKIPAQPVLPIYPAAARSGFHALRGAECMHKIQSRLKIPIRPEHLNCISAQKRLPDYRFFTASRTHYLAIRSCVRFVPICWNVETIWLDEVSRKNFAESVA